MSSKLLVKKNAGDEKNLHSGGRKFIILNRLSVDILFVFKIKNVYSDTYSIMRRVSEKKIHPADLRKQGYFFGFTSQKFYIQENLERRKTVRSGKFQNTRRNTFKEEYMD